MARKADDRLFDRVQDDAVARLKLAAKRGTNLSIRREVLEKGDTIRLPDQEVEISRDTVMVFADDAPLENWGHACRYLLYDPEKGGLYREVRSLFPPDLVEAPPAYGAFHQPVLRAEPKLLWRIRRFPRWPFWCQKNWYAVLFSGASNNRHTNDLEFLYRVLRHDYGVPADQIYVLNYDGTVDYSGSPHPVGNWPGDGTPYTIPVNAAGTKSELEAVFDELKGRLRPEDSLLIHTNNHGGRSGSTSTLITHSGPSYTDADFGAKIGELPKHHCLMVMMEQCFAGGFNPHILANSPADHTSVASAAIATQTSIGGPDFDPFAHDWISAMHRAAPDGSALPHHPDTNGDGEVSAREAFDYADSVHHPHDTPNYDQSSSTAGWCSLGCRPPRWLLPELEVLIDRYWLDPGPIDEAIRRVTEVLPAVEELLGSRREAVEGLRSAVEEHIRRALR